MHHRVVFIGRRAWLLSRNLKRLRADHRVSTAATYTAGARRIKHINQKADIVLVQIGRTARRALTAIEIIAGGSCPPRCIAVAKNLTDDVRCRLIALGVWGEVPESASCEEYLRAILHVRNGRLVYPPHVLDRIETRHGRMSLEPDGGASPPKRDQ